MNVGVDLISGVYHVLKLHAVGYHDKRSGLGFRHSEAGFRNVIGLFSIFPLYSRAAKNPVYQSLASWTAHISVAKSCEEFSQFRLEDDDEGEHSDIENHVQDGFNKSHVQGGDKYSYEVQ